MMADSRKLERTKTPGVYRRHANGCDGRRCDCGYVVRWKHRSKSHKRFFRTYAEAREFKGGVDGGDRQAPTRQSVADYYEGWIGSYRGRTSRGLDESTRREYRTSFEQHVLRCPIARQRMRDVTSRDVSDWFSWLERHGVRPPTMRKAKAAMSAMLATAAQEGAIPSNPVLGVRYVPSSEVPAKRKRRQLTVADVDAILAVLEPQWRLFMELLAHTGLRVSEAIGLTWRSVHLGDDPHLMVVEQVYRGRRKRLKTDGSARRIPLSQRMARELTAWRDRTAHRGEDSPVFATVAGTPLGYGNLYNRVLRPALRDCGMAVRTGTDKQGRAVYDYQGVGFHAFRKACGSILLQRAGKNPKQVQGWLGHARLSTTMDIYQHVLDDGLGSADELDLILGSGATLGATAGPQTAANGAAPEDSDSAIQSPNGDERETAESL
jgi:integrase